MYTIIGADEREYGPVTEEQIRQWVAEGRVDAQTKVRQERNGPAGWRALGEIPEFSTLFAPASPPGQWTCPKCGEQIEKQFDSCWRCSTPRPGPGSPSASQAAAPLAPTPLPPKLSWRVEYEVFRGTFQSWEELFKQAADFATNIGRDRLIGISHSEDSNEGVIAVWYWTKEPQEE